MHRGRPLSQAVASAAMLMLMHVQEVAVKILCGATDNERQKAIREAKALHKYGKMTHDDKRRFLRYYGALEAVWSRPRPCGTCGGQNDHRAVGILLEKAKYGSLADLYSQKKVKSSAAPCSVQGAEQRFALLTRVSGAIAV